MVETRGRRRGGGRWEDVEREGWGHGAPTEREIGPRGRDERVRGVGGRDGTDRTTEFLVKGPRRRGKKREEGVGAVKGQSGAKGGEGDIGRNGKRPVRGLTGGKESEECVMELRESTDVGPG